jgi:CubicO group peptidase (beta-lactamase class C family)
VLYSTLLTLGLILQVAGAGKPASALASRLDSLTLGGWQASVIQHGGAINGFATGFWRMPGEDRVVVVLDNRMSSQVPALTAGLAELLYSGCRENSRAAGAPSGPPLTYQR